MTSRFQTYAFKFNLRHYTKTGDSFRKADPAKEAIKVFIKDWAGGSLRTSTSPALNRRTEVARLREVIYSHLNSV
jgi:hypothetical protein